MCMIVSASELMKHERAFSLPSTSLLFFFYNSATEHGISFKTLSPFDIFTLSVFIDFIVCYIHTQHLRYVYAVSNPKSTASRANRPISMVSTGNPPFPRSALRVRPITIGFDPPETRDCACLFLVGRMYVGTYVLCVHIYACACVCVYKNTYIYIYILYFRIRYV